MIDHKELEGKIAALAPSWLLMSEMTGKPSTAKIMGFYAEYFVKHHIAINEVNRAVEAIMAGWSKGWWPDPEQIAARAVELARQDMAATGAWDRTAQIEEACAQEDARKWEHRLGMAQDWRHANESRFQALIVGVDRDHIAVAHLAWLQENASYRKAFKHGAVIQACNTQAGIDERRQAKIAAREREGRARQYGATGAMEDAA